MGRTSPPETVLGQLQRGRGAGWLTAANSTDGANVLLECLVFNPCWDYQVETRADYYGSLARQLNVSAATVASAPLEDNDDARRLRLDVLAAMARRGDTQAIGLLRDRFQDNADNQHIAYLLTELPDGLDGLDRLITSRLDEGAIATFLDWTRTMLPWDRWAGEHPLIARAISSFDAEPRPQQPTPTDLDAPLDVILAHDWVSPPAYVVQRFVHAPVDAELALLRQAATGPAGSARYFALRVLSARRDPCALDLAEQTFAANTSGRDRATLYRYVKALNASETLPLARRWLDTDDSRSGVAASLMAMHSLDRDVPAIRAALGRAWQEQSMYELCSLIEALGRHPANGFYGELRTVFVDVDYSYARKRAAAAMVAVDLEFVSLFARECLWDCEPDTQVIGVASADMAEEGTSVRITHLASSAGEDQDVSLAAAIRLWRG
jgi:hypothetical protein